MSETVRIRRATEQDGHAVAGLLTELGYPTTPAEAGVLLSSALADPAQAIFVAEFTGSVVGLAAVIRLFYFHLRQPIARLSSLVVNESVRGLRIGERLLQAAESWAVANGCAQLELTSSVKRERAHGFYRRAGYQDSAMRFVRVLR